MGATLKRRASGGFRWTLPPEGTALGGQARLADHGEQEQQAVLSAHRISRPAGGRGGGDRAEGGEESGVQVFHAEKLESAMSS